MIPPYSFTKQCRLILDIISVYLMYKKNLLFNLTFIYMTCNLLHYSVQMYFCVCILWLTKLPPK